jgi:hypothetical protein
VTDASGQPVPNATVEIVGLQRRDGENVSVQTDANGQYSLQAVPILAGSAAYTVTAQATIANVGFEQTSSQVNAATPTCAVQDFVLQPPTALYRRVTVCGTINVQDNSAESSPNDSIVILCNVNQADPSQNVGAKLTDVESASVSSPGHYDATGYEQATCTLNPDDSVTVQLWSDLAHCDAPWPLACGSQEIQNKTFTFTLPPQQGQPFTLHLQNANNDIWADYNLALFNDCRDCNTPVTCPAP